MNIIISPLDALYIIGAIVLLIIVIIASPTIKSKERK